MYFLDKIKKEYPTKDVHIFVDMDGVITDYDFGNKLDFKNKRPLNTNISLFKSLSKLPNIHLYILSICHHEFEITDKNEWLNHYCPFFPKENRIIIAKDKDPHCPSKELKAKAIKLFLQAHPNVQVIVIDDDNDIIKYLHKCYPNITIIQDSSLID